MTQKEQQSIDQLISLVQTLKEQNELLQKNMEAKILALQEQVNQKEMPLSLEKMIFQTVQNSMQASISRVMEGQYSPLGKLCESVVGQYNSQLKSMIDKAYQDGLEHSLSYINTPKMKEQVAESLAQNIMKSIFSAEKSQFDKITQEMKADATFRAKLTLAISTLLDEHKNNYVSNH